MFRKDNNNIIEKIAKLRVEKNHGRGRPIKKWMEVIREDISTYEVDEEMVSGRVG